MSTSKSRAAPRTRKAPEAYHHGDLRRALVAVARRMLERGGLEGLSLRELARAANVSHNAPYRHFPSRDALLVALAAEGFAELTARLRATDGTLEALGRAYVDFALANGALYRLMFGASVRRSADDGLREQSRAALEVLRDAVVAQGIAAPARSATIAAWASVHGLALLIGDAVLADDLLVPAARTRIVNEVVGMAAAGVRAGAARRAPKR